MTSATPSRRLVVANWKMNLSCQEVAAFIERFRSELGAGSTVDVALAPASVHLALACEAVAGSGIDVVAQNCHDEANGAHTGEISVAMLSDIGVRGVIIGHSERRHEMGEDDPFIRRKVAAVLAAGLDAILCVGETLSEREAGRTDEVVSRQLRAGLDGLDTPRMASLAVAYEPVWAIGTGCKASSADIIVVLESIRSVLTELSADGATVRLLYGGSVTDENAAELFAAHSVQGALVGSASLDPTRLAQIVRHADAPAVPPS